MVGIFFLDIFRFTIPYLFTVVTPGIKLKPRALLFPWLVQV